MATDRQQRAYDIIREHHALTVSRVERRNSALSDALRPVPKFAVSGWVWVCNTPFTVHQGSKTYTGAKALKAKLSLNWTGPYKVLAVGPCSPADTRTARQSALRFHILIYRLTCPTRMLARAFWYNVASPVPTPTTVAAWRSIFLRGWRNMCSTTSLRNPPRTVPLKTTF